MKRTILLLRIIMPIVAITCMVIFVPWILLRAWITPLPDTIQEQANDAIEYGFDGIIVYVDEAGKAPEFHTAGWKNRENKIPTDPEALFKIASISKLYIAAAVAKLVNNQTLSLDKTLAEYLPELSKRIANANKITLRMLVQHRSGIPNFTDLSHYPWDNPIKDNKETLTLIYDMPADFEPNSDYSYSNTNYLLIGEILNKELGYSHHQYIHNEIVKPLGLIHTYSLLSEVNLDDVSSGYSVGYDKDIKTNDYVTPGGSMVATIQDVGVFLRALNDGSLLNDEEQAIYSSIYVYEHTGLLPGYQSIARYYKDLDTVVIQFVNTSGENSWPLSEIIYNRIVKIISERNKE
ncbi:serine hydrolase domain-containing protein [Chondrinema litorale]|uniref:serine hydrolase domain-containing protein n=1 Tax=Chondrinema litorale TaxID=2994555 RepID=UPI002542F707|nr:serine hydrolase domain-containing protein [Chondrinema litorale]UZR96700.1 serine hydrolase [Chondrinema litorale]